MSQLHHQLARQIVDHLRSLDLPAGGHVTEQSLARLLGASRSPIRGALAFLADRGVVDHRPNRGYFLTGPASGIVAWDLDLPEAPDERIYLAIARDRLSGRLSEVLVESEAIRRYAVSRDRLRRILTRIANEGWIERRPGKGWSFLPMIDSAEAYRDSYEFRRTLEPTAIRLPAFRPDPAVLARLLDQQRQLVEAGWATESQVALFEANRVFHERIAAMAGNRFVVQAIQRQSQLRRLVEYRETLDRARVRQLCAQHVGILEALAADDRDGAARLMDAHLAGAQADKVASRLFAAAGA